ncbi:uncharacterized protein LOC144207425 [Stigmatopora nigra]
MKFDFILTGFLLIAWKPIKGKQHLTRFIFASFLAPSCFLLTSLCKRSLVPGARAGCSKYLPFSTGSLVATQLIQRCLSFDVSHICLSTVTDARHGNLTRGILSVILEGDATICWSLSIPWLFFIHRQNSFRVSGSHLAGGRKAERIKCMKVDIADANLSPLLMHARQEYKEQVGRGPSACASGHL